MRPTGARTDYGLGSPDSPQPRRKPQIFLHLLNASCSFVVWGRGGEFGFGPGLVFAALLQEGTHGVHSFTVTPSGGAYNGQSDTEARMMFTHKSCQACQSKQCHFLGEEKVHGLLTEGFVHPVGSAGQTVKAS